MMTDLFTQGFTQGTSTDMMEQSFLVNPNPEIFPGFF
jgi:hypothetical protein